MFFSLLVQFPAIFVTAISLFGQFFKFCVFLQVPQSTVGGVKPFLVAITVYCAFIYILILIVLIRSCLSCRKFINKVKLWPVLFFLILLYYFYYSLCILAAVLSCFFL